MEGLLKITCYHSKILIISEELVSMEGAESRCKGFPFWFISEELVSMEEPSEEQKKHSIEMISEELVSMEVVIIPHINYGTTDGAISEELVSMEVFPPTQPDANHINGFQKN